MSLKFDIRGFKEIEAALNKRVEAVTKGVDAEMDKSVLEINAKQVQYTPVDTGLLRESNGIDISKPLDKQIFNGTEYAGYVEFGTGGLVSIPTGLESEAAPWKGAGIRKVNMRAQPFFFRAFFEEAPKMLARIKTIITGSSDGDDWNPKPNFPIVPPPPTVSTNSKFVKIRLKQDYELSARMEANYRNAIK